MYRIDYVQGHFGISLEGFIEDRDEFDALINYLKSLYIQYNPKTKLWGFDNERIDEILLWFKKDNKEYTITDEALDAIAELNNMYSKREVQYFRERKYYDGLLNSNFKIIPEQIDAINWCLKRNVYLNASDTGCGKSPTSIAHIMYLFNHNICDKFIIVVPIGTGFNWEYQFKEFTNLTDNDFGHITNENKDKPFNQLRDKKIILISNNTLASVISSYKESKTKSKSLKNFRWKNLEINLKKELDCKNGLGIVVDESHFFKKTSSIKTKALKAIKYQFDYRFYLSATPNINKFEHIYSQINDLDKSLIPMSENAFKMDIAYSIGNRFDRYAINRYNPNKVDYYRNKFKTIMIQLMKSDIKSFKYEKHVNPLYNKLHPLQRQMYQRVCEIEINKLQEEFDKITWQLILNKFPMLLTVIDCPSVVKKSVYDDDILNSLLDKWKLEYDPKFIHLCSKLENYIEEQDEKVLVFDPSPHVLDLLYTQFEKYNPLIIHGSLANEKDKEKERAEKVNLFNNEKKYKLFLLSTHTSSGSLNLQKDCHISIVYTCPQDATELRQLQDRTFRITSENDTNVDIMTYPETIDNIRYRRAVNRLELNDKLTKEIAQEELNKLLGGIL